MNLCCLSANSRIILVHIVSCGCFHGGPHEPLLSLCKLSHHPRLSLPGPASSGLGLLLLLSDVHLGLMGVLGRPQLGPVHFYKLFTGRVKTANFIKNFLYEETSVSNPTLD